ncbi:MAG: hypothetical protein ACKO4Z_05175 [Planctomycetota bacterium]
MIPIGDDNRDRRLRPLVTWTLVALNVVVFVFFQGFGSNVRFTYAWAAVPREIISGQDVVTPDRALVDRATGQRVLQPGLQPTPVSVYLTLLVAM